MEQQPPISGANVPERIFGVDKAAAFLRLFWSEKPPGPILIWTLAPGDKGKKYSHWFRSIDDFVKYAWANASQWAQVNVYFGAVTGAPDHPTRYYRRVANHEAASMAAVVSDLDVMDPVKPAAPSHQICPDRATVFEKLALLPHAPTAIVDSGHGLQAFWIFRSPWIFSGPEDRERARGMAAFGGMQSGPRSTPYHIDATFDFARVMRVPGGINCKAPDNPVDVELVSAEGPHYDPKTFLDMMDQAGPSQSAPAKAKPAATTTTPRTYSGHLILRADAEPPAGKLATLLRHDRTFFRTWHRDRPDLVDQTQSGYDMSLADVMVQVGWTDQEIVNALIAHRHHHGQPEKLRLDYYMRTIAKARASDGSPPVSSHARPRTAHDAPPIGVKANSRTEHPSRAQARKAHPGEPAPPGEPPWWWEPGLGLPLDDAPPARAWADRSFLWPPRLMFPHGLRWVPAGPQHQGAGSIAAITARPSEWESAFPEEPRPTGGHMIAIDDAGNESKHSPNHGGARANDPHSAPGVWIIGNPRPDEVWDPVHIVASVADGLAVASRYPGPVVVCIGTSGLLSLEMGLAEWLAGFGHGAIIHAALDAAGQNAARALRRDILLAGGQAQARLTPGGHSNPAAAAAAGVPLPSVPPDTSFAETLEGTTDWPEWERLRQAYLTWFDPSEMADTDKEE